MINRKGNRKSKEISHRGSLKRDRVLLALASAGDITVGALYALASVPIAMAQISQLAWDHGMSTDMRNQWQGLGRGAGGYKGEAGLFRDMAHLKIYIAHLKREGLVNQGRRGYAALSNEGRRFLERSFGYPSRARRYSNSGSASKILTMVIFDIPEKQREKREWLRFHLRDLGFRLVQGSVWLGNAPLPAELIKDLKHHELLSCVHIFSIDRAGTMTSLLKKFGF